MSDGDSDRSLIRDFLLESNELVEQLDADLVGLEHDADPSERLDAIFRAMHTIKGAASFLNMSGVTSISHAAEDALSSLREGKAPITESVIDALLASVDVLRAQLVEVAAGVPPTHGPEPLIETLRDRRSRIRPGRRLGQISSVCRWRCRPRGPVRRQRGKSRVLFREGRCSAVHGDRPRGIGSNAAGNCRADE
ncbi:MAG: Hpt domain-containing protein [Phycisphaerales bacterium]